MTTSPEPVLDVQRILDALDRHHVDYLAVGGTAANVYGASRVTEDFDCIPERSNDNLARLALAMQELNARFRIEGLTDAEAQALPNKLDALALRQMELSTWRTDAGDFDVLSDLPNRQRGHLRYEQLAPRALTFDVTGYPIRVASIEDIISSKEWADRPKDHEALPELRAIRDARTQAQSPQTGL